MKLKQMVKYNVKHLKYFRAHRYEVKAYKNLYKVRESVRGESGFVCFGNPEKGIKPCACLNDQVVCNNSKCPSFELNNRYVEASKKYRQAHLASCQVCGDMISAKTL